MWPVNHKLLVQVLFMAQSSPFMHSDVFSLCLSVFMALPFSVPLWGARVSVARYGPCCRFLDVGPRTALAALAARGPRGHGQHARSGSMGFKTCFGQF